MRSAGRQAVLRPQSASDQGRAPARPRVCPPPHVLRAAGGTLSACRRPAPYEPPEEHPHRCHRASLSAMLAVRHPHRQSWAMPHDRIQLTLAPMNVAIAGRDHARRGYRRRESMPGFRRRQLSDWQCRTLRRTRGGCSFGARMEQADAASVTQDVRRQSDTRSRGGATLLVALTAAGARLAGLRNAWGRTQWKRAFALMCERRRNTRPAFRASPIDGYFGRRYTDPM
jgi:hypothetical protein